MTLFARVVWRPGWAGAKGYCGIGTMGSEEWTVNAAGVERKPTSQIRDLGHPSSLLLAGFGANDGGRAFGQCADGARWINAESLRDDGAINYVEVLVIEHFSGVIDDPVE